MAADSILLGGEQRPLAYTFGAIHFYEVSTKRSFIADITSFSAGTLPYSDFLIDCMLAALRMGAEIQEIQILYKKDDVAKWMRRLSIVEATSVLEGFQQAMEVQAEKKTHTPTYPTVDAMIE